MMAPAGAADRGRRPTRRDERARSERGNRSRAFGATAPVEPLGPRHPAAVAVAVVAALCVAISVTYPLNEPDFWQHLRVGRAIWGLHAVPTTQLWTWPTFGAPAVTPSWGFRVLVWPFYALGGVWGLFAWRWLTTFGAFAVLLAAARRMGARGLTPWVALVMGGLLWSGRSQIRPETLVAVLMALELWILEVRRHGGPDRTVWLIPIACAWINAHISYPLGFAILGAYVIEAWLAKEPPREPVAGGSLPPLRALPKAASLALVGVLALGACLVNPYGARALWEPFDFFLHGRQEPIYVTIGELQPIRWRENLANLAPLLVFGWPLLLLSRIRRHGWDVAESLLAGLFVTLAVTSVRFLGFLAIIGTPFIARDLSEWLERVRAPRGLANPWARAALAWVSCVAIALPAWSALPRGVGILWRLVPVRACDFMAAHDVRGRGYNTFSVGGYLLWRFWPERDRLPFMDIHQSGTPADRRLYTFSLERPEYWRELDAKYHFDWALLARRTFAADRLPDFLDADSTWALVFQDDAALLLVRRTGALREVAERFAYRLAPAGNARLAALGPALRRDPALRGLLRADLERTARESPYASQAHGLLASLDLVEGRAEAALSELRSAVAQDPTDDGLRRRLEELEARRR